MTIEFPYNKSAMAQAIADAYPNVPADRRAGWLNGSMIATMQSDGEDWYYADNVETWFHNLDLMQAAMAADMNQTSCFRPPHALRICRGECNVRTVWGTGCTGREPKCSPSPATSSRKRHAPALVPAAH